MKEQCVAKRKNRFVPVGSVVGAASGTSDFGRKSIRLKLIFSKTQLSQTSPNIRLPRSRNNQRMLTHAIGGAFVATLLFAANEMVVHVASVMRVERDRVAVIGGMQTLISPILDK